MPKPHEPVMDLIRASMDPASRTARLRIDSPACRVVIAAARADAEEGGNSRVVTLATGTAVSATGLTMLLAEHRHVTTEVFIDHLEAAKHEMDPDGRSPDVTVVMRSLLTERPMQESARVFTDAFLQDQEGFCDLIVDLAEYAASAIKLLQQNKVATEEQTLAELDGMLEEFVNAA
ncbi:hypothetical protein GCM10010232_04180 [Streptomyces amakusaensis]|uniref:Uncharacterized protein n=1 Tax=Streptomyces amakusaensis TaxID=67271 RepID=A0ABW0AM04_9ACTN